MRIVVFGAGAIGSVLGGMLAKAGHEVTLLGRAWHVDAVRQSGLTLSGLWGEMIVRNLDLATRLEEVQRWDTMDWVFVCVKSYDTASAAQSLGQVLGPTTLVCAFQNGLGNYEALVQWLDPARVLLGRVMVGVEVTPGHARVMVCGDGIVVGSPDPRSSITTGEALARLLSASGVPTRATTRILEEVWMKVIYNCALNALCTILEVPYGRLLDAEWTRGLMQRVIEEAYSVAKAQGLCLEPPTAEGYAKLLFERLIPETASHYSSMFQDIRRGKLTEIASLNGAIVHLAARCGLTTPTNELLTLLIQSKERLAAPSLR